MTGTNMPSQAQSGKAVRRALRQRVSGALRTDIIDDLSLKAYVDGGRGRTGSDAETDCARSAARAYANTKSGFGIDDTVRNPGQDLNTNQESK